MMQSSISDPKLPPIPPVDSLRNQIAFAADGAFFGIGMFFIPMATVMTALASQLTTDKAIIGLIPLAWQVAFLLPQLISVKLIHGKTRMHRNSLISALMGRPTLLLFAAWLFFTKAENPTLTVWLLVLTVTFFIMGDGFSMSSWFDMMHRAFSSRVKSRVVTMSGLVSSFVGIGASIVVGAILGAPSLPFPDNYAVLFVLAFISIVCSYIALASIQERPVMTDTATASPSATNDVNFFAHVWGLVKEDRRLQAIMWVRSLTMVEGMASAFYVVFAREQLKLPEASIGVFSTGLVLGGILGTAGFGWVFNHWGARSVIRATCWLRLLAVLLALLVSIFALPGTFWAWLAYGVFFIIMIFNGAINRSNMLGFMSYAQNIAKEVDRPAYIGALNTVAGLGGLMPVFGGLWIDALLARGFGASAYTTIFALSAFIVAIGWSIGTRLVQVEQI